MKYDATILKHEDVMDGVGKIIRNGTGQHPLITREDDERVPDTVIVDIIFGAATEDIFVEDKIVRAGGIDTHVLFINPWSI